MRKPSKTNFLILLLIASVVIAGFFTYQWWQVKGELAKQIEQNVSLTKQINELQKEIEELKSAKEDVTDKTTEWKTYENIKQGLKIKFPREWHHTIWLDEKENNFSVFQAEFGTDTLWLGIKINMFTETTPAVPPTPLCHKEGNFTVFGKNKLPKKIISTFQKGVDKEECDKFLLGTHLVYSEFCVDKSLKAYSAEVGRNGEYFFSCREEDTLYDLQLYCEGEEWKGKEGRNGCSQLFNQILSTLKLY